MIKLSTSERIFTSPKFLINENKIGSSNSLFDTYMPIFFYSDNDNEVMLLKAMSEAFEEVSVHKLNILDTTMVTDTGIVIPFSYISSIGTFEKNNYIFYIREELVIISETGTVTLINNLNEETILIPDIELPNATTVVVGHRIYLFSNNNRYMAILNMETKQITYDTVQGSIMNPVSLYYDGLIYLWNTVNDGVVLDDTILVYNIRQSRWVKAITVPMDVLDSIKAHNISPNKYMSIEDKFIFKKSSVGDGDESVIFKVPYNNFSLIFIESFNLFGLKYLSSVNNITDNPIDIYTISSRLGFGVSEEVEVVNNDTSIGIIDIDDSQKFLSVGHYNMIEKVKMDLMGNGFQNPKIYLIKNAKNMTEEELSYISIKDGIGVYFLENYDFITIGNSTVSNYGITIQIRLDDGREVTRTNVSNSDTIIFPGSEITILSLVTEGNRPLKSKTNSEFSLCIVSLGG